MLDEAKVELGTDVSIVAGCTIDGRRAATGIVAMSETVDSRLVPGGDGMSD